MSRKILDDIATQRVYENANKCDIRILVDPKYQGSVLNKQVRVTLSKPKLGVEKVPIFESLLSKFEILGPREGDCYIVFEYGQDTKTFKVSSSQLRLLKALALEQVSQSSLYSEIIYQLFGKYLLSLITGKPMQFDVENATPLKAIFMKEFISIVESCV